MKKYNLSRRLYVALLVSIIILVIALFNNQNSLEYYINATFLIGLFSLIVVSSYLVINGGFFSIFSRGFRTLFKKDSEIDTSHWSFEKTEEQIKRSKKIRIEIFCYLPLTLSIVLITQSIILILIYYK